MEINTILTSYHQKLVLLSFELYINGIKQYVPFCAYILSKLFSGDSSIIIVYNCNLFFLIAVECPVVCIGHNLIVCCGWTLGLFPVWGYYR